MTMVLLISVIGCKSNIRVGGYTPVDKQLDDLREKNFQLQAEVDKLEKNLAARVAEIDELKARNLPLPKSVEGVRPDDLPRFASITFGRYSGPIDTHNDGKDDTVRLYCDTLDQKGRLIPVAGSALLEATYLPVSPDADIKAKPVTLARRAYTPTEFSDAYRSGMTGSHYTLELTLPTEMPEAATKLTVSVAITDASTGKTTTASIDMNVKR